MKKTPGKEKSFIDDLFSAIPILINIDTKPEPKEKHFKIDYISTFFHPDIIKCTMFMYSCGILIVDISNYVGLSVREVNVVIDAYVECLF